MSALSNAQRQKRFRERHKTGDLFPPVTPVTPVTLVTPVTPRFFDVFVKTPSGVVTVSVRGCPFCGLVPSVQPNSSRYYISCLSCFASGPDGGSLMHMQHHELDFYVSLWNKRI